MAGSDSLESKQISSTYKDLLQVPNANAGVDGTLRTVMDGEGTESTLQVSTAGVKSTGTLESTGNLTVGGTLTLGGTAISSLEDGATADQTGAQIKTAYEGEADTNAFTDADHTKLDGIEASATADQTGAEIKTAYEGEADTNAFTDADHTKLDAIEASADVTDTTNVTAAGALMDSELTDLAGVKGVTISTLQPKPSEGAFADGDKTKLDGITASANNYSHPNHTGDVTSTGDGATVIANNAVTTDKINDSAVSTAKIADDAVTAAKLNAALNDLSNVNASPSDGQVLKWVNASSEWQAADDTDTDTTYSDFTGATSGADGTAGLVPQPDSGDEGKYLKGDGTWGTVSGTGGGISSVSEDTAPSLGGDLDVGTNEINTSTSDGNIALNPDGTGYVEVKGDGTTSGTAGAIRLNCSYNTHGVKIQSPAHSASASYTLTLPTSVGTSGQVLSTDGTSGTAELSWVDNPDTTYSVVTSSADGLAPQLPASAAGKFLKADGTWEVPPDTDTTYSDFGGADGSSAGSAGLVPQPDASDNVNYLRGDGTWAAVTGGSGTVTSINATSSGGLKTDSGSAITASGTLGMDANSLTSDTYTSSSSTSDSSGWSAGDEIVVVDSGTANDPTKKIKMPCEIGIACSDESTEMSTGDLTTIMIPRGMTLTEVKVSLTTTSSSDDVSVDLKYKSSGSGSENSIFDSTYLTMSSGDYTNSITGFYDNDAGTSVDVFDLAEDSFITVELTNTDSAARGLKVWLLGYWS